MTYAAEFFEVRVTFTYTGDAAFRAPLITSLPGPIVLWDASPVNRRESIRLSPVVTIPSRGNISPDFTTIISPQEISLTGVRINSSPYCTFA